MKQLRELADEQLVSLFQKGNNNAFDILLKRYESKVFSPLFSQKSGTCRRPLPGCFRQDGCAHQEQAIY